VEQYLLAFGSDLAPIVGQQITLTGDNGSVVGPRIDLLIQRASVPFPSKALNGVVMECDLVAHVAQNGRIMGYLYDPAANNFIPDDESAPFRRVPPGSDGDSRPRGDLHRCDAGVGIADCV
jgi:hypothetical protein